MHKLYEKWEKIFFQGAKKKPQSHRATEIATALILISIHRLCLSPLWQRGVTTLGSTVTVPGGVEVITTQGGEASVRLPRRAGGGEGEMLPACRPLGADSRASTGPCQKNARASNSLQQPLQLSSERIRWNRRNKCKFWTLKQIGCERHALAYSK